MFSDNSEYDRLMTSMYDCYSDVVCIMVAMLSTDIDFFFLMIRRPPRSTPIKSSAASDVYKRQLGIPQ